MQAKSERFEMRLDPGTIDAVDEWRGRQGDMPSRAEAIRRLVEAGLETSTRRGPVFNDGETLIVSMICEIYKHLKIDGEIDPNFVQSALFGGHLWGLRWKYPGLFHGHVDNDTNVSEVVNILDMWSFLESGFAKLSKVDKARVKSETGYDEITFIGFDGNNESEHLGIARFLIEELDRFASFKKRDLNSHMPVIESYRRMYHAFEPIRRTLTGGELNAGQIIEMMKARVHPDNRK